MIRAGDKVRVRFPPLSRFSGYREVRVLRIEDHRPVDGRRERSCIARLSDGSWEFVWNLEKVKA